MANTKQLSISVPAEIDRYLRRSNNISERVCEAVEEYRARAEERRLEKEYRADREETERIHREWEGADAEVSE